MRDKIYKVIKDLQRGNINYNDAVDELCDLHIVINPLPTKDEFVSKGWCVSTNKEYSVRRSVRDKVDDVYYSGWMDCYDWMISNDL